MIEILIGAIASLMGGHFTEQGYRKKYKAFSFFLIIFILTLIAWNCLAILITDFSLGKFFTSSFYALITAVICTFIYKFCDYMANKNK